MAVRASVTDVARSELGAPTLLSDERA